MTTYRVAYTYVKRSSVDIEAPGLEEAKEFFWLAARSGIEPAGGDFTQIEVVEHP